MCITGQKITISLFENVDSTKNNFANIFDLYLYCDIAREDIELFHLNNWLYLTIILGSNDSSKTKKGAFRAHTSESQIISKLPINFTKYHKEKNTDIISVLPTNNFNGTDFFFFFKCQMKKNKASFCQVCITSLSTLKICPWLNS